MENTSEKNDRFDCYEKLSDIYHRACPMTQQSIPRYILTEMYKNCHKTTCTRTFRATLCVIVSRQMQTKGLGTVEQIQ